MRGTDGPHCLAPSPSFASRWRDKLRYPLPQGEREVVVDVGKFPPRSERPLVAPGRCPVGLREPALFGGLGSGGLGPELVPQQAGLFLGHLPLVRPPPRLRGRRWLYALPLGRELSFPRHGRSPERSVFWTLPTTTWRGVNAAGQFALAQRGYDGVAQVGWPEGEGPVLLVDGEAMSESVFIAQYLDDAAGGVGLQPSDAMRIGKPQAENPSRSTAARRWFATGLRKGSVPSHHERVCIWLDC